ncbi:hypothetical protein H6F77_04205 [Microcoleus sp. FACHB-831]|uniref:hypothetical protein n=1 Tax=Microcoleus sp. FACHB-831 TaxID=2692827 RepID=UPI00198EEF10|nr:hypothetical protein [Microcoleus sp. FACHB-831]MBD1920320.1 hypothetical protein [Microcoleus sp. FACHB-831]
MNIPHSQPFYPGIRELESGSLSSVKGALHKEGMKYEPPRRQERQERSFLVSKENKIIPQICNAVKGLG